MNRKEMSKFEKMWKILKKECVKNKGKGAKWLFFLYLMNRIEREINVHEETKTDAEFNLKEARLPKSDGQNL
jgi:hypothetical protein